MRNDQDTIDRTCKKCGETKGLSEFPVYRVDTGYRRYECRACNDARVRKHHEKNKAHRLNRARERYSKDPSKYWPQVRKDRAKELARERLIVLRDKVFSHYGKTCACCGELNPLFLSIDHINNDGAEMRMVHGVGVRLYRWLIKNGFPPGFQVLCLNCNIGKARNGGICPHKT